MSTDKLWFVRAGESGVFAKDFIDSNVVAIGWPELGKDIPIGEDDALQDLIARTYSTKEPGTHQNWAGQIRRYHREPAVGNAVVTYDPDARIYHLGLIESGVTWREHALPRARQVSWSHHLSRDVLSDTAKQSLRSGLTLFLVPEDIAAEIWTKAKSDASDVTPEGRGPSSRFWKACVRLAEIYEHRPSSMSGETEQFKLSRVMKEVLATLAADLVPSTHWLTASSVGIGNWVRVPWVAAFDTRETTTAQKGAYFVLHVVGGERARLRFGLGVGLKEFGSQAADRAATIRAQLGDEWRQTLVSRGFVEAINANVELPGSEGIWGMVLARHVPIADVLEQADRLNEDLRLLLGAYKSWVEAKTTLPPPPPPPVDETVAGASVVREPSGGYSPAVVVPDRAWLENQTLWNSQQLDEVIEALEQRMPQVILAGPPGTGKTWVAQAIAKFLTRGRAGGHEIVQFHPSYSYEEFIEGLRPIAGSQGLEFRPVDGLLVRTAKNLPSGLAKVLIVDEINRANLPKVFGELMYLLEYRGQPINLQYSQQFALPEKLYLIGTMNTADRSIRSIDVALRRRFEFFECPPDAGILERFYQSRENEVPDLVHGFRKLNERLTSALDRHHTVGHTFFMAKRMDPVLLQKIWRHRIGPLIEEYLFDQPDVAAEFEPARFWSGL